MTPIGLAVLGDIMVELPVPYDRFPGLDRTIIVHPEDGTLGGGALNLCWYLKQLGGEGRPCAVAGSDQIGRVRSYLEAAGIESGDLREVSAPTNLLIMFVEAGGTRSIYVPTTLDPEMAASVANLVPSPAPRLFAGSRSPVLQAAIIDAAERDHGDLVFAPSYAVFEMAPGLIERYLRRARLAFFNRIEAAFVSDLAKVADAGALAEITGTVIVETRGAEGARLYGTGTTIEIAARSGTSRNVVGAGDGFAAALIAGRQRGLDWQAAGDFAAEVAADIVRQGMIRAVLDPRVVR